jgi:hypothetical protein
MTTTETDDQLYYATGGGHSGDDRVLHVDPGCHRLEKARNIHRCSVSRTPRGGLCADCSPLQDLADVRADGIDDTVLVMPSHRSGQPVAHFPSEDNPRKPRCKTAFVEFESLLKRRSLRRLPNAYGLCKNCDPDYEIEKPQGEQLSTTLSDMDPDDLTADGGDVA